MLSSKATLASAVDPIGPLDQYLIHEGRHWQLWQILGAHLGTRQGEQGCRFAVWAPEAAQVSVIGDFNGWSAIAHPLIQQPDSAIWEGFVPGAQAGQAYKYAVWAKGAQAPVEKADPLARSAELPPATASVIVSPSQHRWCDADWLRRRAVCNRRDAPIAIYEVHLASWRRPWDDRRYTTYKEAAVALLDYVLDMGFTHIEFMPLSEFPFDGSWGYQPVGLYAPTSRYGSADDFRALVDAAHQRGIGVIVDWVPAHFPEDSHGLSRFDGSALYEYADPREGFHQDWNTLIYNFGRYEVANFLIANALYWLDEFHLDGLRVDAVASMLYRDYSRKAGEWLPNRHGGRENLEAIAMLQRMNTEAYGSQPGIATFAEESTAFPGVSSPVNSGGLGFGYKWNMGWMNDTLHYMAKDPIYRQHHHQQMTFGLHYAFTENFVLPISHDEVVHGKGSMLGKMPGSTREKFANLRAYYGFMWGHPGKKLLFMGCEFAQVAEWNHDAQLAWGLLEDAQHSGMQAWVRDLNRLYRSEPALYRKDCEPAGFRWLEAHAQAESLFVWQRNGDENDRPIVVVCNFSGTGQRWHIQLPVEGFWSERLNSDAQCYGGDGGGNYGVIEANAGPLHESPASAWIYIPPLSVVFLAPDSWPTAIPNPLKVSD